MNQPQERAAALMAGGRFHEAVQIYAQELRADANAAGARLGLARALIGTGDTLAACAWLSDALRIDPSDALAAQALADTLLGDKRYAQAERIYARLIEELGRADRRNHLHLGFCREQAGDIDAAREHYERAIALDAGFLEAHVDLAGILWRLGDFEGSLAHAQRAVAQSPDHPYAVRILGTALLNLNRLEEAEQQLRRALALRPGFVLAELDLAFVLLLGGRLADGWPLYARRWEDTDRLRRPPFFDARHEWQGPHKQPLAGQRIAVYAEQGLGDVIQFIRYVPALQAMGATVFGVIQHELVRLVEHSFPGVVCLTRDRTLAVDLHVALLDLPMHLGVTLERMPAPAPYLRAPPDQRSRWQQRLAPWRGVFKVGIAWSGYRAQVNNRNRAIALSQWQSLLQLPGVQCFSLQKGDAGAYTDIEPAAGTLLDFTADWHDFTDSAAMLDQLDLVITVDTALAHLAGALGRPTWVLLPPNADWRWLLAREDSPWYAGMRLFRRDYGEARQAQMERVLAALRVLPGCGVAAAPTPSP